jgi:hypothetical protein
MKPRVLLEVPFFDPSRMEELASWTLGRHAPAIARTYWDFSNGLPPGKRLRLVVTLEPVIDAPIDAPIAAPIDAAAAVVDDPRRHYLSDGVYVRDAGGVLELTGNAFGRANVIYLESGVYGALRSWARGIGFECEP